MSLYANNFCCYMCTGSYNGYPTFGVENNSFLIGSRSIPAWSNSQIVVPGMGIMCI